jgi:spore germination cell wall hydrolase CwlJ-like protein
VLLSFSLANLNVPTLPDIDELNCLAANVYYEARGEPFEGQVAIAKVTLNRVADKRFPKTICEVVFQPNQFSWTTKYKQIVYTQQSLEASYIALNSTVQFDSLYYHAEYVAPKWKLQYVAKVGKHIFYKDV